MAGETNLAQLVRGMTPTLNTGEYVFISLKEPGDVDQKDAICEFREKEGTTLIIPRSIADNLQYSYEYVASWITLNIHSSLAAPGLTAIFSAELAKHNISCNVIAAYYHDHIFVDVSDANKAIQILTELSKNYKQ